MLINTITTLQIHHDAHTGMAYTSTNTQTQGRINHWAGGAVARGPWLSGALGGTGPRGH